MKKKSDFITAAGKSLIRHTRRNIRLIASISIITFTFVIFKMNSYTENVNRNLSGNLIRLHVVANSDSPEDQELKNTVRDNILAYVRNEVKDSKNIEQTRAMICEKIPEITNLARETIQSNGYSYDVETTLGVYPFPTRAYGDIALPAGNYQALKVVIGNGEGSNWWCVLFPPLCFVDVTHGTVPDFVRKDLQEVLTDEEYSIITSADSESEIPVKIKFKIVELFQESKIKLASAFLTLFSLEG